MAKFETVDGPAGKLEVSFGLGALMHLERTTGRKWADILKEFAPKDGEDTPEASISLMMSVAASGLTNGSRKAGKNKTYTAEDVADIVDEDEDFMTKIMDVFSKSMETPKSDGSEGNGQATDKKAKQTA